jgi:hypothetical protein
MKINVYSATAVVLIALLVLAWGFDENGDPGFAGLCAGICIACFMVGAWTRRWWMVPVVSGAWFFGWMQGAIMFSPDDYTAAVAFWAPGIGIMVALGVGAGRRRRSRG